MCIQGDFFIALRPLHFENIKIGIICRPQIDFEHLNLILFSDFERVRRGGFFWTFHISCILKTHNIFEKRGGLKKSPFDHFLAD